MELQARKINVKESIKLRELLTSHNVLNDVETGRSVILDEGRSLTDLEMTLLPGTRLIVIPVGYLGGG